MLSRLDFSSGYDIGMSLLIIVEQLIIVLIALTFHEVAHGIAARLLGDDTAKNSGRLSLNPFCHLDLVGFICMLLFGFGWAKPVPINARRFKNPKLGMAVSALAGPVMNLILALGAMLFYEILLFFYAGKPIESQFFYNLLNVSAEFLMSFHYLNIALAVFNFIPVPPLDGSRVLYSVLPDKLYFGVMKYERYISMALLLLLFLGFLDTPLGIATGFLSKGMDLIIPIFKIFG